MSDQLLELDGRHFIAPGTKAMGGIFLARAAIVVDYAENPEPYDRASEAVDVLLADDEQRRSIMHIANAVNRVTRIIVPYSETAAGIVLDREARSRGLPGRLDQSHAIGLSKSFYEGGICQQQALLNMVLLELHEEKYDIGGVASISEPSHADPNETDDCHIHVEYTLGGEEAVIMTNAAPAGYVALVNKDLGVDEQLANAEIDAFLGRDRT